MKKIDVNDTYAVIKPSDDTRSISALTLFLPAVFDTSLDNISVYSASGQLVYSNIVLPNTLNVNHENDFSNSDLRDHQAFKPYFEALNKTLSTGNSHLVLVSLADASLNRVIYDLVHFSAIKNEQAQVIGALAIGRDQDFDKQKKNETTKKHEQYLRALLDTFPFIVWMKNKEGRYLAINSKFAEVVGAKNSSALEGKTDFEFFPASMAQGYVDDDDEILKTRIPKNLDERIQKSNGEVYWAETYKSPVTLDGEVIGTVGFARDISERLKLKSEIIKRNNAYLSLVQNLPATIIRYDLESRRIFINSYCDQAHPLFKQYELNTTPLESWSPYIINLSAQDFMKELHEVMQLGIQKTLEIHSVHENIYAVHQVRIVPERDEHHQVCGALTIASDISELAEYRRKVEKMAYHDVLTGLPNRVLFAQKLSIAIDAARKNNHVFALMIIDLDQFKSINDTMGHAVGDKLLIEVAKRLSDTVKTEYLCARLGGDEFIILVDALSSKSEVEHLSNMLLNRIMQVYLIEGAEYFVSASIGIAYYPDDSQNMDDLLKYADSAMYHAKKHGRNRYHSYSPSLTKSIQERLNVETELRRAIEKNEIYLEYQPIVDIASQQALGVESLCRWKSSKLGQVVPTTFIQIAEETGMIVELGEWVMREAFKAAHMTNSHRQHVICFSVNLSARQFLEPDFIYQVHRLLTEQACNPAWIKFEITESLLLETNQQVRNALKAFDDLGIKISLDDFGTGQSALAYLSKFPIHQVKIDRSFINEITTNSEDALLVKAIIALAATLNKELVAEGVETQAQASLLSAYECQNAQGYLYSKPIGFEALTTFLNQDKA